MKQFSGLTESKNFQYGLIEYFYPISDHISKQCLTDQAVWTELFEFLNLNIKVSDPEIRNTSLNIFAGIINNYGGSFSPALWQKVFSDIYLVTFERIFEVFFNLLREESPKALPDTPEFVLSLKDQFDIKKKALQSQNSTRKPQMMAQPEFDSAASQWQETVRTLIQSFNRIVAKYLTFEPKIDAITEQIYQKSFYLFRITNKTIFTEVSLTLRALLTSPVLNDRQRQTLLEEVEAWLKKNKNQGQAVHDMMHILAALLEDVPFISSRPHFQLLMRIYIEILYFSAFSDEYSTYFYNLEILTKTFLKSLFGFFAGRSAASEEVFPLFAQALPEMFVTKIINKKANETGCQFLNAFFDELATHAEAMGPGNFKLILEKLFLISSLRAVPSYTTLLEGDKECMYLVFFDRMRVLVDKVASGGSRELLLVLMEAVAQKSLLVHELFPLRGAKFRERIVDREIQVITALIFRILDDLEGFRKVKGFESTKFFGFLQAFKSNFLKVEPLFSMKVEAQVDPDECFLPQLYRRLADGLTREGAVGLQAELLLSIQQSFVQGVDALKTNQLVDKRCPY